MIPDILVFRSSSPKYSLFENAKVHNPVRRNSRSIPTMTPRELRELLSSEMNEICLDTIGDNYMLSAINKAHYFFVAFDHAQQKICGVLFLHIYETWSPRFKIHRFGYVDLVCSRCKTFGTRLVKEAEAFCKDCLFMRLNALTEKVSFYEKIGYKHETQPCDPSSVARPWSYVRNRKTPHLGVKNIGAKMTKCLVTIE